eukprot:417805-Rhodomonas_salina.2
MGPERGARERRLLSPLPPARLPPPEATPPPEAQAASSEGAEKRDKRTDMAEDGERWRSEETREEGAGEGEEEGAASGQERGGEEEETRRRKEEARRTGLEGGARGAAPRVTVGLSLRVREEGVGGVWLTCLALRRALRCHSSCPLISPSHSSPLLCTARLHPRHPSASLRAARLRLALRRMRRSGRARAAARARRSMVARSSQTCRRAHTSPAFPSLHRPRLPAHPLRPSGSAVANAASATQLAVHAAGSTLAEGYRDGTAASGCMSLRVRVRVRTRVCEKE